LKIIETRENRGKPTTCKVCKHEFKHKSPQDKEIWEDSKYPCPKCGELFVTKPKGERELFLLQDEFFEKGRDTEVMNRLAKYCLIYTQSIVKKYFSNCFSNTEELVYISDYAVSFVIENFYTKESFYIRGSWKGLLYKKIEQACFSDKELPTAALILKKRKDIKETFSIQSLYDDGHEIQIENPDTVLMDNVDKRMDNNMIINSIIQIIEIVKDRYSIEQSYKMIIALNISAKLNSLKRRNPDFWLDKYWKMWGNEGKTAFIEIKDIITNHLENYAV
jgi:hypothetical protein